MEDLDALLADLQSTTAHISNQHPVIKPTLLNESPSVEYSQVEIQHKPVHPTTPKEWTSNKRDSTDSLEDQPPPLPPPPSQDVLDSLNNPDLQHTTFEVQNFQNHSPGPGSTPSYSAESEQRRPKAAMSTLSSNLSELDSLLADLNSAQFMAEVDKRNSANRQLSSSTPVKTGPPTLPKPGRSAPDSRPVDALLDDLQNAVPSSGVNMSNGTYQAVQPSNRSFVQTGPVASTATKELDDLMASLSQFKVAGSAQPQSAVSHVAPTKNSTPPPGARQPSPGVQPQQHVHQQQHQQQQQQQQQPREDQLDAMLGNLSTDMSRHGVNTVPKGHCGACNKPIVGQVITALGQTWHPEHFTCSHCDEELGTRNFFERDAKPYCEKDYHTLFSPRCAYCNGPILDKCITALDRTWHPEHFVCFECGRPFENDGFHEKDGKAYCRADYFGMFAPKCGGCGQPIMDNYISALNRQWHPECFVCTECRVSFAGGSFFEHETMPYCEMCYHSKRGSLCYGCQKPITGRCITAMNRKFHPEHFVCAFCLKQLNKGTFKEQNDKPYCHPCFVKLFG